MTPYPPLTLCGLVLEVSSPLKLPGITIDYKVTFEKHIRNIAFSITQKTVLFENVIRLLEITMQY